MARMSIVFDGFEKLTAKLDAMGKDLKPAVNEALEVTQQYIQQELEVAVQPYVRPRKGRKGWAKGSMADAVIKNPMIEWQGSVATVKVGFSSQERLGFMHSIFVMYGVPRHGKFNKGYSKDTKIFNAIKGTKTKNRVKKLQQDTMEKYLK
mgnify:CR=1 FL=1